MPYRRALTTYHHISFLTVWPSNLVYCALFNTLHAQWYVGIGKRGGISRERFFVYAPTSEQPVGALFLTAPLSATTIDG